MRFAGRNIRKANSHTAFLKGNRSKIIVSRFVEHTAFNDRSRSYYSYNISFYKTLCGFRVFNLFANCDFMTVCNKPCYITLTTMIRYSAHRCSFFKSAVFPRQNKFKFFGNRFCVLEKHFVKIAKPEKQNAIFVLLFNVHILSHHRR